jgi:hypothetical protein
MQAGQTPTEPSDLADALTRLKAAAQEACSTTPSLAAAASSTAGTAGNADAVTTVVLHLRTLLGGSNAGIQIHHVLAAALKLPQIVRLSEEELR